MIIVYGRATSSNVQIVMWALAELGLAHERLDYGHSFGGLDTPDYLAMNPHGKIPTLRDGDLLIWESAAILRYLAARYGTPPFWPDDPAHRARLDMWGQWVKHEFASTFNLGIFWPMVRVSASERDTHAVALVVKQLKPMARILDERIGKGPFMDGPHLSFADILIGHLLYRYYTVAFERAETPNLDAYYERLKARPHFAAHVMVSYDPLRAPGA